MLYVVEYRNRKRRTRWQPCPAYAPGFVSKRKRDAVAAINLHGAHEYMDYRAVPYRRVATK